MTIPPRACGPRRRGRIVVLPFREHRRGREREAQQPDRTTSPLRREVEDVPALSEVILRILWIEVGVREWRVKAQVLVSVVLDELVVSVIDSDPY